MEFYQGSSNQTGISFLHVGKGFECGIENLFFQKVLEEEVIATVF